MRVLSRLDKFLAIHFIGPYFEMDEWLVDGYNSRQLVKLHNIVSLTDWKWDKCGIDDGVYDFRKRLCGDKDNPLYYFQNELLVDVFETVQGGYYPAVTSEQSAIHAEDPGDALFGMEEWNESNDTFWQQWVKQEMSANMDKQFYSRGLSRRGRPAYDVVRWVGNCDGANTFAQDLIWYKHRMDNSRCLAGEKFYIAYISLHSVKSIRSVIMAVGVFVHENRFYSTMGITKSFRLTLSDTSEAFEFMKQSDQNAFQMSTEAYRMWVDDGGVGSSKPIEYPQYPSLTPDDWIKLYNRENKVRGHSVRLQRYIANELTRLGHVTVGLLFRPNGLMRKIMMGNFNHCLIGSNIDIMHIEQQRSLGVSTNDKRFIDSPPLIIQSDSGGTPTICIEGGIPIQTPFWEPPSPYSHPDSSLNPHLPLMFISMCDLVD